MHSQDRYVLSVSGIFNGFSTAPREAKGFSLCLVLDEIGLLWLCFFKPLSVNVGFRYHLEAYGTCRGAALQWLWGCVTPYVTLFPFPSLPELSWFDCSVQLTSVGSWFSWVLSCVEFAFALRVCGGFLSILQFPSQFINMKFRLICNTNPMGSFTLIKMQLDL